MPLGKRTGSITLPWSLSAEKPSNRSSKNRRFWIIKNLGPIKDLTITTYSIGAVCINTLMKWYDSGRIEEIYFYIASYAKRIAVKNVDLLTAQANARERITVGYGFNHSKVMLARTENDYIVICDA